MMGRAGKAISYQFVVAAEFFTRTAHKRALTGLAFSPDGLLMATVSDTGLGFLWSTDDWTQMASLHGHSHGIHDVAFSPDSRRVITSSGLPDSIKLWDTASYQEVLTLGAGGSLVRNISLLDDGRTLAATGRESNQSVLHVWRAPTWEQIARRKAKRKQDESPR